MLASITPLGERGRHSHYAVTMTAFALAGAGAGALAGAVLGAFGSLVAGPPVTARLLVLAAALLLALGLDLRPGTAPGPRRQVNERWLDSYRGWVYGAGFGAQLGLGVTTIVTSAATYVALLAAALTGSPGAGAVIVGVYGAIRGLTPLLAAGVRTPAQLTALHARLDRGRRPAVRAGQAALGLAVVAAVIGALV